MDEILHNDRVCRRHFVSGQAAKAWDRYNVDWVPTLNLGHDKKIVKTNLEQASQRGQRTSEKERKRKEHQERERALAEEIALKKRRLNEPGGQVSDIPFENELPTLADASSQTDEFEYLFSTAPKERPFDEFDLCNNDKKVNFHTGLHSFEMLNIVFRQFEDFVACKSQLLTPFQEFVLTLMKLKLNMPLEDLAYGFNVSVSTISRVFLAWMVTMDTRLSLLIKCPDRKHLWHTMSQCFQFPFRKKTTVIIDCFEVFIDRPSNLLARAQT